MGRRTGDAGTAWRIIRSACAIAAAAGAAAAQLGQSQVLVVYDSRIPDSRAVAEYYAGSARVPGGQGGLPGKYRSVRVFNLATSGAPQVPVANTSHADYRATLRNPIRTFLTTNNLAGTVRCIVLTKGLPHRLLDTDEPFAGDSPNVSGTEFNAGDITFASVDSELTMLWQNTETNETGNGGDSKLDGLIYNPFWRSAAGINSFSTANNQTQKTFVRVTGLPTGAAWNSTTSVMPSRFTAGDMMLVARLDAKTVADVRAMIDRGGIIPVDVNNAAFVLDEANSSVVSNGSADASPNNGEWDNDSLVGTALWSGDDYEKTRDILTADARFAPANIRYNKDSGVANFIVGPLVNYQNQGVLVTTPVLLLGSWGSNSGPQNTQPQTSGGINAGQNYTTSFNLARGAAFNSVESYNARDFYLIGSWFGGWGPQAQISDFIQAGGTFAIGNCWEPFTFGLPDHEWVVRNFYLGQMTWVEAAWSSIPCLSWQTIVVGDPLSTVVRSSEDRNGDGRIDAEDLIAWDKAPADINRDGIANATDKAFIEASARRAE